MEENYNEFKELSGEANNYIISSTMAILNNAPTEENLILVKNMSLTLQKLIVCASSAFNRSINSINSNVDSLRREITEMLDDVTEMVSDCSEAVHDVKTQQERTLNLLLPETDKDINEKARWIIENAKTPDGFPIKNRKISITTVSAIINTYNSMK